MYDLNGDHDEPPNERQPIASAESSDHDPAEQRPEFLRQRRGGRGGQSRAEGSRVSTRYWITWSARSNTDCGIFRPSAFAVLRLMTSSNLVGCSTGRSAGLAPLRILST
jgi:hypothetical protein